MTVEASSAYGRTMVSTTAPAEAPPQQDRAGGRLVLLAMVVTVVVWGSAFVGVRSLHTDVHPGAIALGRLLVGAILLSVTLAVRGRWVRPTRREWLLVTGCAVFWFGAYNVLLNTAERHIDAGTAAMLVNVAPILIALLAGLLLGEGLPRWLLVGGGVAFLGVVVIGVATARGSGDELPGVVLCVLAACCWAIGVVAQKPALRRLPALQVTQMGCALGALACLPFAGQLTGDLGHASGADIAWLVYLGSVPTALGFGTWAYALSRMPAGRLGVTTYLVPPVAVLAAWPILGETPPPLAVAGGLLALAGVALSRRR